MVNYGELRVTIRFNSEAPQVLYKAAAKTCSILKPEYGKMGRLDMGSEKYTIG
jgi:hypothetical protein